jgi:hypothetical protein
MTLPPAARGKAHGAWRFAHSVNHVFTLRPALCTLRIPLDRETSAKTFIKAVMVCSLKESDANHDCLWFV